MLQKYDALKSSTLLAFAAAGGLALAPTAAADIACDAANKGAASTTYLYRNAHWPTPREIAWVIPFQYVFLSRLGQQLVSLFKGGWPTAPAGH